MDSKEAEAFFKILKNGKFRIRKLFLDWCPEFKPFLAQVGEIKTLEFLIIRGCGVEDDLFISMMEGIKANKTRIRLLDMYSNRLTDKAAEFLGEFVTDYKYIESFGFGMNNIKYIGSFINLFDKIGVIEVGVADFNTFKDEWKHRENIVAKNTKAKISKKPEEPLPYVEEVVQDEATGKYYKRQYPNLLFLNLVGNNLMREDDYSYLEITLKRATNIQLILSYTKAEKQIPTSVIESFWPRIYIK